MRFKLDTGLKTITVEGSVNLEEFFNQIKLILPNDTWKEYSIQAEQTIVNWVNPYVIHHYEPQPFPTYPWITCGGGGGTSTSPDTTVYYDGDYTVNNGGEYCIDIQ